MPNTPRVLDHYYPTDEHHGGDESNQMLKSFISDDIDDDSDGWVELDTTSKDNFDFLGMMIPPTTAICESDDERMDDINMTSSVEDNDNDGAVDKKGKMEGDKAERSTCTSSMIMISTHEGEEITNHLSTTGTSSSSYTSIPADQEAFISDKDDESTPGSVHDCNEEEDTIMTPTLVPPSELNKLLEQSVSRLAMSMKRSERSRQKILDHIAIGSMHHVLCTTSIGTS